MKKIAKDGGVVYGRTMEWGTFDLNSRVAFVTRNFNFTGLTPDGQNGKQYSAKYGFVGLDMIGTDFITDGLNEKGLSVGMFFFQERLNMKNQMLQIVSLQWMCPDTFYLNFQLPLGPDAAEGNVADGAEKAPELMRSSTIWTTAWNLTDLTLNYHTQHNRRVRRLDLTEIDFVNMGNEIVHLSLDKEKKEDIENITPKL